MLLLIPLLPFAGFLVNASLGRRLPKSFSGGLACAAMLAAFLVSLTASWPLLGHGGHAVEQVVFNWLPSGDLQVPFALRLDQLSTLMILVITGIGSLIHIYSVGYMHEETDSEYARYFSYLNLFASFMLVLVLGSSFPVMFVGWEGVGLCSYLLIGFYYKKQSANDAGKKAFVVNRVGDFGFILGMLLIFTTFGTLDFQAVAAAAAARRARARHGRDDDRDAAALRRRHRQVGADSAAHLAAGRDGRPDAGLGADSRRDDGHRRRLHDRPQRRAVLARAVHARSRRRGSASPRR